LVGLELDAVLVADAIGAARAPFGGQTSGFAPARRCDIGVEIGPYNGRLSPARPAGPRMVEGQNACH